MVYLLEIYSYPSIKTIEALCKHFRLSNRQKELACFLKRSYTLLQRGGSKLNWVDFYAAKHSQLALDIYALHSRKRDEIIKVHKKRVQELNFFILLRKQNRTVVTAKHLMQRGIMPGKRLGDYLKQAWTIAVNGNLKSPQAVLARLF